MDNLFGKDDSGNDSDPVDVDDKDDHFNSFDSKQSEPKDSSDVDMDTSQVIKAEFDGPSAKSVLDQENGMDREQEELDDRHDIMDIVKHEIEIDGREDTNRSDRDGIIGDVLALSYSIPMGLKDRRESKEKSKRELEEEEREKMQVLVSNFTEDQLDRYEMYRRAAFPKAAIKRIMQTITGCSVSQNVVIAMSGIAKVFVGEIVEEALDVMEANEETGPLQPKHLREANGTRPRRHTDESRRASRFTRPSNNRHRRRHERIKSRNSIKPDGAVNTSRDVRLTQSRRKIKAATHAREEHDRDEDLDPELEKSIEWDDWGNWTKCSVTCGTGRRIRWRHCIDSCPMKGLKRAQMKPCHRKHCPKGLLSWIGIKS